MHFVVVAVVVVVVVAQVALVLAVIVVFVLEVCWGGELCRLYTSTSTKKICSLLSM